MDKTDLERRVHDLEEGFALLHKQIEQLGQVAVGHQASLEALAVPAMQSAQGAPLSRQN